MSDVSQGPGWWQASDLKWYPPEAVPGDASQPPGTPGWEAAPIRSGPATSPSLGHVPRVTPAVAVSGALPLGLMVTGAAMIAGSFGAWFTLSGLLIAGHRLGGGASVSGTTHGGAGWISFVAGVVLIVAGLAVLVSRSGVLRLWAQLAAAAAGAGLGIAIYTIVNTSSQEVLQTNVGWGLIVVLIASIAAFLVALTIGAAP